MNKVIFIALIAKCLCAENLTDSEEHSLGLAEEYIHGGTTSIKNPDGAVTFLHGATMPRVVAAPLRTTDITLQAGEVIEDIVIGDTVRWIVSPSISGSSNIEGAISHVNIKPVDAGLETTLSIYTDRRAYNINLKSTEDEYIPIIKFVYSDELNNQLAIYKEKNKQEEKAKEFNAGSYKANIDSLDFNYYVNGDSVPWKPIRIYNDGTKTFIDMPSYVKTNETPALLVIDTNDDEQLVNYRFSNNRYIVDKLFEKAILVLDVGTNQNKVLISRKRESSSVAVSIEAFFEAGDEE